ncbi:cache domain-containing protein, partial [Desulfonatronospira sp.]|uniref:cache domain-containing protein n=1 Tax=Desulfonatronospira sp. TaxID=1962951 RepID=UPI0025BB8A1B
MKLSSIRTKLAVVGVIPIVLFLALIIIYLIPVLEETIFHEKEIQTMEMVNTALGIIENLHQKEMQGELSRQEAQERAMESIASMTFGEDRQDYFWINDYVPNMVMHPFRPDLDGEYIGDFQDPDGLRLFQEMVEAVERHDAGYVEYQWQYYDDQDRIEPKLSYVAGFEPWEWIVGTGVYIHDVQQIAGETRNTSLFWTGV